MTQRITYDEFVEKYKPVKNHLVEDAPYDGYYFETYGVENDYITNFAKTSPKKVWTILTGLECGDTIVQGWHYVNRYGYFITEESFQEGEEIEILLEGSDEYGVGKDQHELFAEFVKDFLKNNDVDEDDAENLKETLKKSKDANFDFEELFVPARQIVDQVAHFDTEWSKFLNKQKVK